MSKYDFKNLSWLDFEDLCADLLSKEEKCLVETFKEGKDGGVDLRCIKQGESTIIQCKHYAKSGFSQLLKDLKKELPKVEQLDPSNYKVMTSVALSVDNKAKIYEIFKGYMESSADVLGVEDLNRLLSFNGDVERKHFKLWLNSTEILSKILHNKEHVSNDYHLSRIEKSIPLYVDNGSFNKARKILDEKKVVVISGVAGVGKSTLADMLFYMYISEGFEPIYVSDHVDSIRNVFDKNKKQVIVFDDFLGDIRLDESSSLREDRELHNLIGQISESNNHRFILTTREYILKQASEISECMRDDDIGYYKYVLDIGLYTRESKAKILFNHLDASDLPQSYIESLLKNKVYKSIIDHHGFNPRLISLFGEKKFYSSIDPNQFGKELLSVLKNPVRLYDIIFNKRLSEHAKLLLIVLSICPKSSKEGLKCFFDKVYKPYCDHFNIKLTQNAFLRALKELDGSLISIHKGGDECLWLEFDDAIDFINPSVKEFVLSTWENDISVLRILLEHIDAVNMLKNIIPQLKGALNDEILQVTLYQLFERILANSSDLNKLTALKLFFIHFVGCYKPSDVLGIVNNVEFKSWNLDLGDLHICLESLIEYKAFLDEPFLNKLERSLKSKIINSIPVSNIEDIHEFLDFFENYKDAFEPDEFLNVKDSLKSYLETFTDEMEFEITDLDEFWIKVLRVINFCDLSIEGYMFDFENIREHLERDDEVDFNEDPYEDLGRGDLYGHEAFDDTYIDDMFIQLNKEG